MKSVVFVVLFYSISSFATISDFSVDTRTASRVTDTGGNVTVYGGIAGSQTGGSCPSSTSVCNNCAGGLTACNNRRVTDGLLLSVTFKSTESGAACVVVSGTTSTPVGTPVNGYVAGNTVTIQVPWQELCNKVGSPALTSCGDAYTLSQQFTLEAGVAKSGTCGTLDDKKQFYVVVAGLDDLAGAAITASIESFVAYPGDEKVYLKSIESYSVTAGYSPEHGAADIQQIGAFYAQDPGDCSNFASVVNNTTAESSPYFTDVNANGELTDNRIRHLTNDITYVFRMAAKDDAENIGLFTTACVAGTHTAMPDDVFGILEDKQNCFIATAAFGSILDPHVQTFRDFRDQFLRTSFIGKKFVKFYYENSPPLAKVIAENDYLRAGARMILFPLWGLAWMYLNMGTVAANLVLISLFSAILIALKIHKDNKAAI